MAAQGRIYWNEQGNEVFALTGTELEINADSVSSEWTTESEGEECQSGKPEERRRVRNWRLRYLLRRDVKEHGFRRRKASSSSSSSSSTSTGSSSSSSGDNFAEVATLKRPRQVEVDQEGDDAAGGRSQIGMLTWLDAEKKYRCVALVPGFLSSKDIETLHVAARNPSVRKINDRKGYLAFKHQVWRFDLQLRALLPELYTRLLDLMVLADADKWQKMAKKKKTVYPEVEYIDYDVQHEGGPCFIEPHVDNKSAVTLVAMLSAPQAYTGGRSCFRRVAGRCGHRELALGQGDVVLFRGEKLLHWITPVTWGRRTILQVELSRV